MARTIFFRALMLLPTLASLLFIEILACTLFIPLRLIEQLDKVKWPDVLKSFDRNAQDAMQWWGELFTFGWFADDGEKK